MRTKKALSFLFGLTLALQGTSTAAFAAETEPSEEIAENGEVSEEIADTECLCRLYEAPASLQSEPLTDISPDTVLPSKVDLRTKGKVTSVKNQGDLGTCWAHAVLGSIETDRISEDPHIDLSERCLASLEASDEYGSGSNSLAIGSSPGTAMGLLSNWIGVLSESVAPYDEEYIPPLSRKEIQSQAELHMTNTHCYNFDFFDTPDDVFYSKIRSVKKAVCDGHGVYLSMNFDTTNSLNYGTSAMYNTQEFSSHEYPHAVLIVGYDDDYSADNFLSAPEGNGAWLVKNSWGLDSGDNGYYWVSYFDHSIDQMVYFEAVPAALHDHLYTHDDYGVNGRFSVSPQGDTCTYISNIYTADENGFITDVMLNCCVPDDEYEITVYTGLTDASVPTSGEAHSVTSGTIDHIGYHTITLSEPVHISEGENFAIVAKLSGEEGYHIACEYSTKTPTYNDAYSSFSFDLNNSPDLISEDRILKTFGQNQSFFSSDGKLWNDLYGAYSYNERYLTGNICLRAMTSDEGAVHFSSYSDSLAPGTELSLSCADGKNIYYSIDNGDYMLYTQPVTFTKDMTVSAYVEGDEENVYSRHYSEKHAEFINLLVSAYPNSFYADIDDDIDISVPVYAEEFSLTPTMTGVLTDGETVTGSYEKRTYPCDLKPFDIELTAEEEGLSPTNYKLHVHKECNDTFSNGTWMSMTDNEWYYFNEDGKTGYHIDKITGKKTDVSYTIANNVITMTTDGNVRKGMIASNYTDAFIEWEDGNELKLTLFSSDSESPCLTHPELKKLTENYFKGLTGKAPISVDIGQQYDFNAEVTVVTASGETLILNINEINGIGSNQNGDIIDLNVIPEETGIKTFKPGIWSLSYNDTVTEYLYFAPNGKDCASIYLYDGYTRNFSFSIENNQFRMIDGEYINMRALATIYEDKAILKNISGSIRELDYICDATPETFKFLTDSEIFLLASDYCEKAFCLFYPFNNIVPDSGNKVTVFAGSNYLGEYDCPVFFNIDRVTGECTDQDGNVIDLYAPIEANDLHFKRGLWKAISEESIWENVFYWFGNEDEESTLYECSQGFEKDIRYRGINGNGIAEIYGEKVTFTYFEDEDGMHIRWIAPSGYIRTELLTYVKPMEKDQMHFYAYAYLYDWIIRDYEKKSDSIGYISDFEVGENNDLVFHMVDAVSNKRVGDYVIDPFTGKGTNEKGEAVDLPRTGVNSLNCLFMVCGAIFLIGAGLFIIKRSGIKNSES